MKPASASELHARLRSKCLRSASGSAWTLTSHGSVSAVAWRCGVPIPTLAVLVGVSSAMARTVTPAFQADSVRPTGSGHSRSGRRRRPQITIAFSPVRRPSFGCVEEVGQTATMPEAFIVDAVRTPTGKEADSLVHPADLGARSLTALIGTGVDPAAVDVVFGNVDSVGGQAGDIARTCARRRTATTRAGQPSTDSAARASKR